MELIGAFLIIIAINVVIGLFKSSAKQAYRSATAPRDTLRAVERDAKDAASHVGMNDQQQRHYINQQRFGTCFARFAVMVSIADGTCDDDELRALYGFFAGADPSYLRGIHEGLKRDLRNPQNIDWDHTYEMTRQVLSDDRFSDFDMVLCDGLLSIAAADGRVDPEELATIYGIMIKLGWSEAKVEEFFDSRFGFLDEAEDEDDKRLRALTVLGLAEDATFMEIKKAYRALAKQYHPDVVAGMGEQIKHSATERFHEISEAYEYLSQHEGRLAAAT